MTYTSQMETINIANLKSTLSAVLRKVREGEVFQVMDRQTPIAKLSAYEDDTLRIAKSAEQKLSAPNTIKIKNLSDPIKILREDRDKR